MIKNRKTAKEIPIDILRLIHNRSQILSLIILINGHGQIGKSTFVNYMANRLKQIQLGVSPKKATWREWDYKKFTSTNPQQFVQLWDQNENEILALEEAGEQMNYMEFWGIMSRVFSSTTRTQGLKHNICFLITPFSRDISKYNRECVDFKIWVRRRDDVRRMCGIRPRFIKIDYVRDKYKLGFIKDWNIFYPKRFMPVATEFTNWLKGFKTDIASKNKYLVQGFDPTKPISKKNMDPFLKRFL